MTTLVVTDVSGNSPVSMATLDDFWRFLSINWLAFNPEGDQVACASMGGLYVFDVPTLAERWNWKPPGGVDWVDWSADGRHLCVRNDNSTVYVLRMAPPPGKATAARPDPTVR